MITLTNVSKAYGDQVLYQGVNLQINDGDRVGLVGPNGSGKSTLFRLLMEEQSADDGKIMRSKGLRMGYLPQEFLPNSELTVLEETVCTNPELRQLETELHEVLQQMKVPDPPQSLLERYDRLHAAFEHAGGYEVEYRAKAILNGLGFRQEDLDRPLNEMSGGWMMRVELAKLLLSEPHVLLLDEPTNHLDLYSLLWFQQYLQDYRGTLILVSHDRSFLNAVISSVVELRANKLLRYTGDYDSFVEQRDEEVRILQAARKNQEDYRRQSQRFINRFRAKSTKASQVQSRIKQLERMEEIPLPDEVPTIHFRFPPVERSGLKVVELRNVSQAYGERVVYRDLNLELERGKKTVLVGPNGAGKSTLLKILGEQVPIQSGEIKLGLRVAPGYYSQHRTDLANTSQSVLDAAMGGAPGVAGEYARTVLGGFLFRGDDVLKPVSVLSGGEKSRLSLVKHLLSPPNLLLLDEPTTHLDIDSVQCLIDALKMYEGTLVFISHDLHFIREIADQVLLIEDGQLTLFRGDYEYFEFRMHEEGRQWIVPGALVDKPVLKSAQTVAQKEIKTVSGPKSKEQKRREAAERQKRAKQAQLDQQARAARGPDQKAALLQEQAQLAEALQKPEIYNNAEELERINRRLKAIAVALEEKNSE
ncbi:MAG: ATP-binding cassette domain-containing protein [Candidatus Omnitrophica bacterium]|nr:ATP-binding cassette domain-containing protein [Candidatus Omnitrophota bacterium]